MNSSTLSPKFKYKSKALSNADQNKRCFTQVISEDNHQLFNIQIKGMSLDNQTHLEPNKTKSKSTLQQTLKNSLIKNKEQNNLMTKWVITTAKFIRNQNKQQTPLKRSITVQSVYDTNKNVSRKMSIHSAIKRIQQKNFQKNIYQKQPSTSRYQNVDKETNSNFKNIIDQFNKVKTQIKQKEAQEQQKKKHKTMRIFYKKPNFYEYQQFYRQNYQAKQMKQDIFLFKKISYLPLKNPEYKSQKKRKIIRSQSQKKKLQQKPKSNKKKPGIYIHLQNQNSLQKFLQKPLQKCPQKSPQKQQIVLSPFITLQPYLNIKSHQFSKTSRNTNTFKKKINIVNNMNKTSYQYKKKPILIQNQKIQPWTSSLGNFDYQQHRLNNIF